MDIVSHGLWGSLAFGRKSRKGFWLAFLFGIGPDLFSFGPFFAASFLGFAERPRFGSEPPDPSLIPAYVHQLYHVTHSLPLFAVFFLVLALILRRPLWEFGAWGFHVLFDIPTHSYAFFPTPFLWPISEFKFNGWQWGSPWIFFPNIGALAVLYFWFFLRRRRR